MPDNLPGPLYARKVQRRAASSGFDFEHVPYEAVEAVPAASGPAYAGGGGRGAGGRGGGQTRLAPWSTGGTYLNFAERHKAGTALFGADMYRQLQQVKAAYDPDGVF